MHSREAVRAEIIRSRFIPIIRTDTTVQATRLAEAVIKGGARLIEITMTVPGALDIIQEMKQTMQDKVMLGAGTILDSRTARQAILQGADFIVTPVLSIETIRLCRRYSALVMPGATTPTEILHAWEAGADFVKVFPVDGLGGPAYIKGIKAPLAQVEIVPTGGVNLANAKAFIDAGAVAVGIGSSLVGKQLSTQSDYDALTQRIADFLQTMAAV
jgi:2-dehydro-3-deoxyphosphogluconate aldolase/(4S)-4-hydroxy-2-oxoglutarate aldolase